MKTLSIRGMITAAALLVAAGVASAQTYHAELPVAFRAGGANMNPGSYTVNVSVADSYRVTLYNRSDGKSVMIAGSVLGDVPASWLASADPKVTLQCMNGGCVLQSLYRGTGSFVQNFVTPKPATNLIAQRPQSLTLTMIRVK